MLLMRYLERRILELPADPAASQAVSLELRTSLVAG